MATAPVPGTARAWLLSPAPASRTQARCGRWFRAWLGFRRNTLDELHARTQLPITQKSPIRKLR